MHSFFIYSGKVIVFTIMPCVCLLNWNFNISHPHTSKKCQREKLNYSDLNLINENCDSINVFLGEILIFSTENVKLTTYGDCTCLFFNN